MTWVYNFGEHAFRKSLAASNDTIPDQLGKPTKNPAMRWTFRIMNKITVAYINTGDSAKTVVANICNVCRTILKHFSKQAMQIYGIM